MQCPVNYISINQEFGKHKGVDFGWYSDNHHNQWIYAVDDGIVIYNRHQISGGYVIHIRHDNGFVSEYGHLLKNSQQVHEGDRVKKGQKIAKMGKSGMVTGEHLHFGLYKGTYINYSHKEYFVNPLKYINVYDNQHVNEKSEGKIRHTKKAQNIPSEPMNIRKETKTGKVVGHIYNGDQVETYGCNLDGWNIVDNTRDYICSNRYLKDAS